MDKDYYVFRREYFLEPEADPVEDYVLFCEERRKLVISEVGIDFTNNLSDIWNISEFLRSKNVRSIFTLDLPSGGYLGVSPIETNEDSSEAGYEEYSCLNRDDIDQFRSEGLEVIVL